MVAIDADAGDVNRRVRQLISALAGVELPPRTSDEKIVHLIPRRNIETWILNLNGNPVDEEADFRHVPGVDDQIGTAAQTFFDWSRPNAVPPSHCVPSLGAAIPEMRRLEFDQKPSVQGDFPLPVSDLKRDPDPFSFDPVTMNTYVKTTVHRRTRFTKRPT
jgi:hypothetical protein